MSVMAVKVATDSVAGEPTIEPRSHSLATPVVPEPSVSVPLTVFVAAESKVTLPIPAAVLAVKLKLLNVLAPKTETAFMAAFVKLTL